MKYFAHKFAVLTIFFLIFFNVFSLKNDEIFINLINFSEENKAIFEIILPKGWKMAKAPNIRSQSADAKFNYQENFEKIEENKYEVRCNLDTKKRDILKFKLFVCKDVCAFVHKDFIFIPEKPDIQYLLLMIFFGFLGGLLLNVMPCVLPVILLKIRQMNSKISIVYSLFGNYLTFLVLALILFILKLSGESVGWGFYFQNVYFLKSGIVLFFIMTLMSFDKLHFHINMNFEGFGDREILKHIFSSVITTLVAIPCTAPLLGTAAAFAIQESFFNMFLIFMAMATGFSTPYFFALFTKISFQDWFRKPILNTLINYGVLITMLWLFWVLARMISLLELGIVIAIFLISFVLITKKLNKFAFLLLFSSILVNIPAKNIPETKKFDEIYKLVSENHIVIVNITADWCLSCKYNKLKFQTPQMSDKIRENHVRFIEIDITQKNDEVMNFIKRHSRIGIPFTIIYGPKNKQGIVLSEMPSISEITKTIDLVK